ncbi:Fc.00g096660.m01.CDS01 [Cosmosporella sp. VM-42]
MLFSAVVGAVLASVSVLGAPLEARADPYFTPSAIWKYSVSSGAISSTSTGVVSKATNNNGNDITALLTFKYPSASAGKKCQFAFYLNNGASLTGSKKLDLFTSNSPAPGPTSGWGPGNQRNIHLGRLSANLGGFATWDATYSTYLTKKTDCKAPGTTEAFELVGVYDNDYVSWNPTVAGPRIIYT